ncbi:MAG: hypothetical protein V7676_16575 [Parasphingorhabdus sp.]|uniref:hypothetical protein n=1 Tax=Parasphingorhabdus sp. TaxID=2709688 RepID=UPI0030032744
MNKARFVPLLTDAPLSFLAMLVISGMALSLNFANPVFAQDEQGSAPAPIPTVTVCPDGGYENLCTIAQMEKAISLTPNSMLLLSKQCLYQTEARCWVNASGTISSMERGGPVIWQHMLLAPNDGPATEMVVLAELDGKPVPMLVAAAQTEGWFLAPDIAANSDSGVLIHLPGRTGGNGAGNADILVRRTKAGWSHIDLTTWFDEINAMLPLGFELQSGINFNFREMHASSPVWRAADGHCCPTGGTVQIDFTIDTTDQLIVTGLAFDETKPVGSTIYLPEKQQNSEQSAPNPK